MQEEPALGMIEFKSVARGIFATDALVKKAPVRLLQATHIEPGKYMTIFGGAVGDVEEALQAGVQAGRDSVIQQIFIPHIHQRVLNVLEQSTKPSSFGALGVVETFSVCACVYAADRAAKTTPVELVEMHLAEGLGGKGYFVMTGVLPDLEASLEAAWRYAQDEGMLANYELIPSPHPELLAKAIHR